MADVIDVKVDPLLLKEVREKTGAALSDCKRALQKSNNDPEEAIRILLGYFNLGSWTW